jgi:hypothetical protein
MTVQAQALPQWVERPISNRVSEIIVGHEALLINRQNRLSRYWQAVGLKPIAQENR